MRVIITDCWSPHSLWDYQGIRNSRKVEAELKGLLAVSWWDVWKKYILGVLAIGSGLMLGREGPSIQLGQWVERVAHHLKSQSSLRERSLIAGVGLLLVFAAAFENAPIAGLFVVERGLHHFSRFLQFSTLAASLTANFISSNVFGQTPVLHMPQTLHLSQCGFIFLGVF